MTTPAPALFIDANVIGDLLKQFRSAGLASVGRIEAFISLRPWMKSDIFWWCLM